MEYDNRFEKILGSVSKDKFRQYANKLLNECFILKECADTKNCYYFILKEKDLQPGDHVQYIRNGYFVVDTHDSTPEHMVFNRVVGLKSSYKPENK